MISTNWFWIILRSYHVDIDQHSSAKLALKAYVSSKGQNWHLKTLNNIKKTYIYYWFLPRNFDFVFLITLRFLKNTN